MYGLKKRLKDIEKNLIDLCINLFKGYLKAVKQQFAGYI